jgi:mRNA interferase HigB
VASCVKVLGRNVIYEYTKRHADVRGPAAAWLAEVDDANRKTRQDVRERYPTVSFIGDAVAVFNLKGQKYRVETIIAFNTGVVVINRMGTHAEYTNWTF